MKRLILPLVLIAFAIICLSIVHIDNVNKLDTQSEELRKKYKIEQSSEVVNDSAIEIVPETK